MTAHPVAAICRALGTANHVTRARPDGFYRRAEDETVLRQIRAVTSQPASNQRFCSDISTISKFGSLPGRRGGVGGFRDRLP